MIGVIISGICNDNWVLCSSFIVSELLWYIFLERKQAKWQLAHFIWLSVSGLGGYYAAKVEEMPSNNVVKTVWEENDLNLRAYHTFGNMIDNKLNKGKKSLECKKDLIDKYNNNTEKIKQIKSGNIQIGWNTENEKIRVIYDLEKENNRLYKRCEKIDEDYKQIANSVKELRVTLDEIKKNEVEKLQNRWIKAFPNCIFKDGVIKCVIEKFSYSELGIIESRIYELHNSDAPFAWANKRSNEYIVFFSTNNAGLGKVYYSKKCKDSNDIVLCNIERSDLLKELSITPDEVKRDIKQNSENNEIEYQRRIKVFIDVLEGRDREITNLKQQKEELELARERVEKQLASKQSEVKELKYEVTKSNRKCIYLESQIEELERDKKNNFIEIKNVKDEHKREKNYQDELLDKLRKASIKLQDIKDELSYKDKEICRLNSVVRSKEDKIRNLTENLRLQKEEYVCKIKEFDERIIASEGQSNLEKSLRRNAEEKLKQINEEKEKLRKILHNSISKEEAFNLKEKINEKEKEIKELNSTIKKLELIHKESENKIYELKQEKEKSIRDYEEAIELVDEYERKYQALCLNQRTKIEEIVDDAENIISNREHILSNERCNGNVFCLKNSEQILVIGACRAKSNHLIGVAKKYGLNANNLEFWDDYDKLKRDMSRLYYNTKYRAIILGPMPHKVANIDGYSSLISKIMDDKDAYPPVEICRSSGELKISKTSFKVALNNLLSKIS